MHNETRNAILIPAMGAAVHAALIFQLSGRGSLRDIKDYYIADLAFGAQRCRIDWIGAVTFAERYRRTSQPLIEIQLSKVSEDISDANSLFNPERMARMEAKQIRLPISFLSFLKIGDIWQEGRLSESPDYEIVDFHDLMIDRTTTSIIKAGLNADSEGSYYLPHQYHPFHMRHTQSYCTMVACGGTKIIVPAAEMIRFYFGSSGDVIARIFDVPFDPAKFWTAAVPGEAGRKPKIDLAPGISCRSAPTVGRIAFSKAARSTAELIGNSCVAAASNGQEVYPKAGFPFWGKTDLNASGRWLPLAGKERGVFLVFQLRSCSHPFPFIGLDYTGEGKGAQKKTSFGNSTGQETASNRYIRKPQSTNTIVDAEPDKTKKKRDVDLVEGKREQFPDLGKKRVAKVDIDAAASVLRMMSGASDLVAASVGDNGADRSIQPVDFVDAQSVLATARPQRQIDTAAMIFLRLVASLSLEERFSSVEVVRLDKRQRYDFLCTMPQIINEDDRALPWCSIQDIDGRTRYRKISIGRAEDISGAYYFLIPETMPSASNTHKKIELHLIADWSKSIPYTADLMAVFSLHLTNLDKEAGKFIHTNGMKSAMHGLEYSIISDAVPNEGCPTSKAAYDLTTAFMQSRPVIGDFRISGEAELIYSQVGSVAHSA